LDAGARGSIAGAAEHLKLFVLLGSGRSGGNLPISIGLPSKWETAHHRRGKKARAAEQLAPLVLVCGRRALSLIVQDVSTALYLRQREDPGYLPIGLIADDQLQLADARPMLVLIKQPPIVRQVSTGKPHGGGFAHGTGGHVMSIAPTLKKYLTAENIQYEEVPHEFTVSSTRTAEACHISGDRLAKGVVLRRDGGYMLAVMPASHHLRLSELRAKLGNDVDMADETEIGQLFRDCAHGAVPAVGKCYGLDLIVDDSIEGQPEVYVEAGDHQTLLRLNHAEFARLTANAPHGHFSVHD
jgi:Ala-tRNA(Pro) deacylase